MPGRIFVSYRRDDDPSAAARARDGLAATFGRANLFMDVDDLLAGLRFDEELAKALATCDVFIAIIGARWMDLFDAGRASGERDYVHEEIAEALKRRIVVIPVLVGRDGQLPPLPRADGLPAGIRDLVLYQKHDVAHEHFGRDIAGLSNAIAAVRVPWGWVGATTAAVLGLGYAGLWSLGMPLPPFADFRIQKFPPRTSPPSVIPESGGCFRPSDLGDPAKNAPKARYLWCLRRFFLLDPRASTRAKARARARVTQRESDTPRTSPRSVILDTRKRVLVRG